MKRLPSSVMPETLHFVLLIVNTSLTRLSPYDQATLHLVEQTLVEEKLLLHYSWCWHLWMSRLLKGIPHQKAKLQVVKKWMNQKKMRWNWCLNILNRRYKGRCLTFKKGGTAIAWASESYSSATSIIYISGLERNHLMSTGLLMKWTESLFWIGGNH